MKTLSELHGAVLLSNEEITERLTAIGWPKIIDAIAETFVEEARGAVISPAKTIISFPDANNDFRLMPSYMEKYPHVCGVKIVGACTDNPRKYGLPLAVGIYVLNDKWTQLPLMIFDATTTTAWRTAAASAVAVRELSDPKACTLGIIGCGFQAPYHISAIRSVRDITNVMVFDLDQTKIDKLVIQEKSCVLAASKQEILDQADIIVTMTPTKSAHIFTKDIAQRPMMICAIGGDSEKKMEFEPSILTVADYFCDSLEQVAHTGTVYTALHNSIIATHNLRSLGSLMIGESHFNDTKPIKMFLSTGVALEDLAVARLLYTSKN